MKQANCHLIYRTSAGQFGIHYQKLILKIKQKESPKKNKLANSLYEAINLVLETTPKSSVAQLHSTGAPSIKYIEQCILASDPQSGWERVSTEQSSVAVHKDDVNLRLIINHQKEGKQCEDFKEEWANRHPDPHATGYWCDTFYASTHVSRNILVSVDGDRAMLPIPRQIGVEGKRSEVLPFDYRVAQIFDSIGTLDEYMFRSKLRIAFTNVDRKK